MAAVDRTKTTPHLIKLFYRTGGFHRTDEFSPSNPSPPAHLEIYTWNDCTLAELAELVHAALPSVLPGPAIGTRLAFRSIFPDLRGSDRGADRDRDRDRDNRDNRDRNLPGSFFFRDLGSTVVGDGAPGALDPDVFDEQVRRRGRSSRSRSRSRSLTPSRSRSRSRSPHRPASPAGRHAGHDDLTAAARAKSQTLLDAGFKRGDYISCAVLPPLPSGHVPGPPLAAPSGSAGGRGGFFGAAASEDGARRGPRSNLLKDDWRRGEAPPPPEDVYSRRRRDETRRRRR